MIDKESIKILKVRIDKLTYKKVLDKISEVLENGKKLFIVTANPETLMLAEKDKDFLKSVNSADLVTADGSGILWASKFLSYKTSKTFFKYLEIPFLAFWSLLALIFKPSYLKKVLPEKVSGADLFWDIVRKAYENDWSIFLLGGKEGVAEEVNKKLIRKFPGIKINGFYAGSPEEKGLIQKINSDVLFVAWGQPKQEKWICKNWSKLNTKIAIGVGGTFDFVSGKIKRAPEGFQKIGLEWFWRLFQEPKRIGRIFEAVPKFIYALIKEKFKEKNG